MNFGFMASCILEVGNNPNTGKATVKSSKIDLKLSPNLNESAYLDKDGLPTQEGSKAMTNVFIQGLVANIHAAHDRGFRNDVEHLRYIIAELERGFAAAVSVSHNETFEFTPEQE